MNKRLISILLLAALLGSAACGDTTEQTDYTGTTADTTAPVTDPEVIPYTYTEAYKGKEFRILNGEDSWNMHMQINREEATGEPLNDAMYERCRILEEKMGITITEENLGMIKELGPKIQQTVLAQVDAYDIVFSRLFDYNNFRTSGYFCELTQFDEFQLDKPWWLQSFNDASSMNGELHGLVGYANLMAIEAIQVLNFNETMLDNLKLDYPYDLVREGKWTLDRMGEYVEAAANLNGDESFEFKESSRCIYGLSARTGQLDFLLLGMDQTALKNDNGTIVFTAENEKFYDAVEKYVKYFSAADGTVYYQNDANMKNGDDSRGSYIELFESQQSLFRTCEISKSSRMRDKDFSYGLLPMPKYDEAQKDYYVAPHVHTLLLNIPVTTPTPEFSAAVSDALAYLSYYEVLPQLIDTTITQKNLRNDDSVEMFNLILESSVPLISLTYYNITNKLMTDVEAQAIKGNSSVASVIASYKTSIMTELEKINK